MFIDETMSKTSGYIRRRRRKLADMQDNLCFFCETPLVFSDETKDPNGPLVASDDHFFSRSQGGGGGVANIVIAHRKCNSELHHHPKSQELEERFYKLNILRGLGDDRGIPFDPDRLGLLSQKQWPIPGKAMQIIIEVLNDIPGEDGQVARRNFKKIMNSFYLYLRSLLHIPQKQFRYDLGLMWLPSFIEGRKNLSSIQNHIPEFDLRSHLNTALITAIKKKALGETH